MRNVIATGLALVVLSCAAVAADWPQFLGPNANGISPETKLAKTFPADGPKELWKVDMQAGYGGAAVKGGKVYVMDRIGDTQEATPQDVLLCIDLATGKELWRYAYETPGKIDARNYPGSRSTPAVDDKYVVAIGPFGQVSCLSVEQKEKTAKPIWTKNLAKDFGSPMPNWKMAVSPVIYKDTVIIAPQSKTVGVAALNIKTGEVTWKSASVGGMQYCTPLVATIGGVEQIVMETGEGVAGVKIGSGEILWNYGGYKVPTAACPSPTDCGEGKLFMTGGYNAGSIMIQVTKEGDKFAAKELWKAGDVGSHVQNAVFYKDNLYINSDNKGGGLVCLGMDGKIKWRSTDKFDKGNLLIADGTVFILDGAAGKDGKAAIHLVAVDPAAYKELAKSPVVEGKQIWAPMALSDGKLLVRDQKQLKCLDVSAK